jgi:hypothetical protein
VRRHLYLVPPPVARQASAELVECLREMLKSAEAGHLIGVVGAQMYRDMEWQPLNSGESANSPFWCYATLGALSADLAGQIFRGGR